MSYFSFFTDCLPTDNNCLTSNKIMYMESFKITLFVGACIILCCWDRLRRALTIGDPPDQNQAPLLRL